MVLRLLAVFTLLIASPALALEPVTSTKRPYDPRKSYCNVDSHRGPVNIACYNHDACYSKPGTRSRSDCDRAFLRDCKEVASSLTCGIMYGAIRLGGWASWNSLRS